MKKSQPVVTALVAAAFGWLASAASAQDVRQPEVSIGYLNVGGTMHGSNVQVFKSISTHVGLVGEFDWSKGRDCSDCDPVYRDMAGLGGLRFTWFDNRRVSPFSQVLFGGLHSTSAGYYAEYCCGLGRRYQSGYTIDYAAIQPGAGVTIRVSRRLAIRAHTDIQFAIPDQNQWEGISIFPRTVAAAVIRLGK